MFPCDPAPWTLTWDLLSWDGESWSEVRHAEVTAGVVSEGRDWNEVPAAKVGGAIALGLESVPGFPGCLPLSGQVGELLPGLGLGACEAVDSSSWPVPKSPSAASSSDAVAAEACVAGSSAVHPFPSQVGPFEMWEGAVP